MKELSPLVGEAIKILKIYKKRKKGTNQSLN